MGAPFFPFVAQPGPRRPLANRDFHPQTTLVVLRLGRALSSWVPSLSLAPLMLLPGPGSSHGSRRPGGTSPPSASVAVVIRYQRGRCYPASRTFAGEPDIVGRATGLCRVPGGAGYLDRRLTLVARDRFHPNADDLEIVGRVHAHSAIGW